MTDEVVRGQARRVHRVAVNLVDVRGDHAWSKRRQGTLVHVREERIYPFLFSCRLSDYCCAGDVGVVVPHRSDDVDPDDVTGLEHSVCRGGIGMG